MSNSTRVPKRLQEDPAAVSWKVVWAHAKRFSTAGTGRRARKLRLSTRVHEMMREDLMSYGKFVLVEISLTSISYCGWQPSQHLPDEEEGEDTRDEDRAASYAAKRGKLPPVILRKDRFRGGFDIIDGRHRCRAAFLRGQKTVTAYVPLSGW